MSYDLSIRYDDDYSRFTKVKPLANYISVLPDMRSNGERGFTLDDGRRYMEIDLEVVNEDGDNIEEHGEEYLEINAIRLHIPYAILGSSPEHDYFPIARAIATYLGWELFDEQRDEAVGTA